MSPDAIALDPCPLSINAERTVFSNIGTVYDDGNWFFAAELAQLEINGWLNDWNAGYVSAGRYVGAWLPFVLASKINTYNGDECTKFNNSLPFPYTGAPVCDIATQYNEQTTYAVACAMPSTATSA